MSAGNWGGVPKNGARPLGVVRKRGLFDENPRWAKPRVLRTDARVETRV